MTSSNLNKPDVSVIVSNFNGAKYLPKLRETLRSQRGAKIEIIIVDRNSTDASAAILSTYTDVKVVQEPPESGLVTGYAVGAEHASADLLFFCNEDMWFDPDCLRLLVERIDFSAGIVAADPWQWTYDGVTLIHAGTRFRRAIWNSLSPFPFCRNSFTEPMNAGELIPFPCAGAFLIHRRAYEAVGGWDRSFFLDNEDVDLFIRIWQLGWRCVTVPESKVYHAVGASNVHQLTTMNTPVRRRRFISGTSSLSVIGVKYFTSAAFLYPFVYPLLLIAKDMLRLKLRRAFLSALATAEFGRRLVPAMRFRSRWLQYNRARPGQSYFTAGEFRAAE
jgi:GT2 family glycosyltransferase